MCSCIHVFIYLFNKNMYRSLKTCVYNTKKNKAFTVNN